MSSALAVLFKDEIVMREAIDFLIQMLYLCLSVFLVFFFVD